MTITLNDIQVKTQKLGLNHQLRNLTGDEFEQENPQLVDLLTNALIDTDMLHSAENFPTLRSDVLRSIKNGENSPEGIIEALKIAKESGKRNIKFDDINNIINAEILSQLPPVNNTPVTSSATSNQGPTPDHNSQNQSQTEEEHDTGKPSAFSEAQSKTVIDVAKNSFQNNIAAMAPITGMRLISNTKSLLTAEGRKSAWGEIKNVIVGSAIKAVGDAVLAKFLPKLAIPFANIAAKADAKGQVKLAKFTSGLSMAISKVSELGFNMSAQATEAAKRNAMTMGVIGAFSGGMGGSSTPPSTPARS